MFAVKVNVIHGLPLTSADRAAALDDPPCLTHRGRIERSPQLRASQQLFGGPASMSFVHRLFNRAPSSERSRR